MADLLRAGFSRLWRAPIFWLGVVFMALCGGMVCCTVYDGTRNGIVYFMGDLCRYHCIVTVFLPAVFCALFLASSATSSSPARPARRCTFPVWF